MVGKGTNIKSMAYVENIAAFIEYNLNNTPGEYLFNYIDKPDFDMNTLVGEVNRILGKYDKLFHWPYWLGYFGGLCFDLLAKTKLHWEPKVLLEDGLKETIAYFRKLL
jgi:nucleoside-diphosphate-sugar epimerase